MNDVIVGALTFQPSPEVTKGLYHINLLFFGNDTKQWFLTYWSRDNNTEGVHENSKFFAEADYEQQTSTRLWSLQSTNGLRNDFVRHIPFKRPIKFQKFIKVFRCCMDCFKNKGYKVSFSPFQTMVGALRVVSKADSTMRAPHLSRFILLVSLNYTLLVVSILDIVYYCHLWPLFQSWRG